MNKKRYWSEENIAKVDIILIYLRVGEVMDKALGVEKVKWGQMFEMRISKTWAPIR